MTGKNSPEARALIDAARTAKDKAYSPYSRIRVGAAVRMANGQIFTGCNVENASYGAAICAERVAVLKAVSETHSGERPRIEEVAVVTDASPPWPPCGLCRQTLAEFASPETRIHMANPQGETQTLEFSKLQPLAFTPSYLEPR